MSNPVSVLREDYRELEIARDGKVLCGVVIAPDAPEKVTDAAKDFADLLETMCGDRPPVTTTAEPLPEIPVLIGASPETEKRGVPAMRGYPGQEGFCLKNDRNTCLILLGNDDGDYYGTAFAVTAFFEKLGCGWFGPQELWQEIPRRETVSVGYLDEVQHPQFISRQNNVLRYFPEVGRRWYLGGERRVAGHAFQLMFPWKTEFEKHPDWYCEINGKRDPMGVDWWQFCYSNPELIECFGQKVIEIFDNDPKLTQYSIALNDGWYEGFCECENCRAMGSTPSDIAVEFANRIARVVARKYPDRILTFLAYFPTYFPPTHAVTPEPNVEVMFCKECDMFAPVDKGPDNGYHLRYDFESSKNRYPEPWRYNFEKWCALVPYKHRAIWDWYCIAAACPTWKDIPWVQGDVATRNHRYWSDHGISYLYNDQGPLPAFYEDGDSFALRWPLWYVNAKGMWDKDLTGSDMLLDACRKLYGEAADLMFAYYSALADVAKHNTAKTIAWHPPAAFEVYTPESVERIDRILRAVRALLPETSGKVKLRLEAQLALWDKARAIIESKEDKRV